MHDYNRFKENNQTSETRRKYSDSRRVNPPNQYGRVPHCTICQSIYHWFKGYLHYKTITSQNVPSKSTD